MAVRVTLDAERPDGLATTIHLMLNGAETHYVLQPGQSRMVDHGPFHYQARQAK